MNNWYGKFEKQANALAKSLGLTPADQVFKDIQSFESKLKERGDWQKILNTKKKEGKEAAHELLLQIVKDYKNEPEVNCVNVTFEGKSNTGGEWYSFGHHYEFYDLNDDWGGDQRKEMLSQEDDKVYEIAQKALKEEAEWLLEQKIESGIAKLEKRRDKLVKMYDAKDGRQLSFPYFDARDKIVEKYQGLIKKKLELADKIRKDIEKLDIDEEEETEEWFLTVFDYEVEIKNIKDEAGDEIWSEYTDGLKDQIGEIQEEYSKNVTGGGSWCISQPSGHFETYLANGDDFLILRRNGEPRVAIRSNEGYGIYETQGIANNPDNIDGLDFIDLLNAPYFDVDEVMNGIVETPAFKGDLDDLKQMAIEEILNTGDKAITDDVFEALAGGDNWSFVQFFIPGDEELMQILDKIIVADAENSKLGELIIQSIRANLGEIELDNKGVFGSEYTWAHEVIALHDTVYEVDGLLKRIFADKEEILDEFFGSLQASASPRAALLWALENSKALTSVWGEKVKEYFTSLNMDFNLFDRADNLKEYVKNKTYLEDDLSAIKPETFYDIMEYVFGDFMIDGLVGYMDLQIVNNLWEFGQMIVPLMGHPTLLNDIADHIIHVVNKDVSELTPWNKAEAFLRIILEDYQAVLAPEIFGVLISREELKSAYKMYATSPLDPKKDKLYKELLGITENIPLGKDMSDYRDFLLSPPDVNIDSPVVEGIPNAPNSSGDIMNGPMGPIRPVTSSKSWYKREG